MADTIQIIDKLKEVFTPIAEKIGEGTEFGWKIVVKQQILYGWIAVLFSIFGVMGIIFCSLTIKWAIKNFLRRKEQDKWTDPWEIYCWIILLIMSIIAVIFGSIIAITYLNNPEYYALQFFISLVK